MKRIAFLLLVFAVYQVPACAPVVHNSGPETIGLREESSDTKGSDLPLIIVPASKTSTLPLVFFISGDGGWTSLDQSIAQSLASAGFPVIGLNARDYFWQKKQPDKTAEMISGVVNRYMDTWNKKSFVLMGYSFGADLVPFLYREFSPSQKQKLLRMYCFSPSKTGDFEVHISDMLNLGGNEPYDVAAELKRTDIPRTVCVFGDGEDEQVIDLFRKTGVKTFILPGNHHYGNDAEAVTRLILNTLGS